MPRKGRTLEELNLRPADAPIDQDPRKPDARKFARALQEMRDLGYWEYADDFLGSVFAQVRETGSFTLRQFMKVEEIYEKSRRADAETFKEFVNRR